MIIFNGLEDYGLLLLRLVVGIIFLYHGVPKLSGKHGGFMILIGILEGLSALAIIAGLFTEIAGIVLAIIMLGAIYKKMTEWKIPFSSQNAMGWEFDLILLAVVVALAFLGAGNISVDFVLGYLPIKS